MSLEETIEEELDRYKDQQRWEAKQYMILLTEYNTVRAQLAEALGMAQPEPRQAYSFRERRSRDQIVGDYRSGVIRLRTAALQLRRCLGITIEQAYEMLEDMR